MFISEDCLQTEKEILVTLQDHSIDGYIIFPVHDENFNNEIFNIIFKSKPIVLIDRYLHDLSCPNVTSNNLEASFTAVKHLFDHGHQNIGILTRSIDNTSTIRDRKEGVYKAYAERNIKISNERWLTGLSPKLADFESEKVKIKEFILKNPDITAFFSFELNFYPIFKSAVSELGKRIPDDYSFICFDSSSPLDNLLNPLTHLKQNEKKIAETAFNLLIKKINGEEVPYNNRIDVQLIEGSTVTRNPHC
jgi:DNA-binding LacI/PurR family transcriptional regulator